MSTRPGPESHRMRHGLHIAYVGDFVGHGTNLPQLGTAIAVLSARNPKVEILEVMCPTDTGLDEPPGVLPERVRLTPLYDLSRPLSLLRVVKSIRKEKFDLVIFSLYPTAFGRGNVANLLGLLNPILVSLFSNARVSTIYHNSVRTNDYRKLGYTRPVDYLRARFIRGLERALSYRSRMFLTLDSYETTMRRAIAKGNVDRIDIEFMDAIAGAFTRGLLGKSSISSLPYRRSPHPTILLHGWWGPQKDLRFALQTLRQVRRTGRDLHVVLSGGVSRKFPWYQTEFDSVRSEYADVVDEYLGYVSEATLSDLLIGCDILLLPYVTPGGVSGVLESASFYGMAVIAPDFPEFHEQAVTKSNVTVARREDFERILIERIDRFQELDRTIDIKGGLEKAQTHFGTFVDKSLGAASERGDAD